VEVTVDGERITAAEGASVAAVLLAAGRRAWRTSLSGQPRGLFCGIGVCFECVATIDGVDGVRTCITPVADGTDVMTGGGR
jgi:predicted molibdopterin-dependent oxidoreductase YjgC